MLVTMAVALTTVVSAVPAAAVGGRFVDDDSSVHERSIEGIAAAGITRACGTDRFCPTDPVTRGELAAFLVRGLHLPAAGTDAFTDDDASIFEGDIDRLAAADITRGCNPPRNDRYCPREAVTRGELAALLVRALDLPPADGGDRFGDDDTSLFEADIEALAAARITLGCNPPANDRFCPTDPVTRAEVATFLVRALDDVDPVEPAPPAAERTIRYEVRTFGGPDRSSPATFRNRAGEALTDARGWALGGRLRFERVADDGDFTLWLTDAEDVSERASVCSDNYSCTVGDDLYINDDRFAHRPAPFAERSQAEYQRYVILHEVGHWLGFDRTAEGDNHYNDDRWCSDGLAPVMMQQSISTRGCSANPWPLPFELDCVQDAWLRRDVDQGADCPHREARR
jgi:hypothetical protein